MAVPVVDQQIGIETYITQTTGIGGVIKKNVEDFEVDEILVDGSKASTSRIQTKSVLGSKQSKQPFLLGILVKRNWDTFIALKNLALQLGIDSSRIQIAGIKDAKAITSQFITIEGISQEDASRINIKDLEFSPIGYFHEPICSFYLLGNSFHIKIREIESKKEEVQKRIEKAAYELDSIGGIANFYGHQRFGTIRAITHLVGKALVQGNIEEAAMIFLAKSSVYEHPESMKAREHLLDSKDFKQALMNFPAQLRFERIMLKFLVDNPSDFSGAFRRLPIKLRLLFIQAWQSYLFNRFLSSRIKHGYSLWEAEIGDYVVNVERSGLPLIRSNKIADSRNIAEINKNIREGKLRLAIPIFGEKQKLSGGVMGEMENGILEEEQVEAKDFRISLMPEISARGELRTTICPIGNFSSLVHQEKERPEAAQAVLKFRLLRGAYATVLLREVMKPEDLVKSGF